MDPQDQETANTHPSEEAMLFAAAIRRYMTALPISPADMAAYWARLEARLGLGAQDVRERDVGVRNRNRLRGLQVFHRSPALPRIVGYALAGLVIGMMGLAIGWHGGERHSVSMISGAVTTYSTVNGQRSKITLPDGTVAAIDVASRVEIPADFAEGDHTVHLSGEALFTVSHHDGTPFTVIAGNTSTRVLGTSFLVRHYPTDTSTTVAVQEGRVAVGAQVVTAQHLMEVSRHGIMRQHSADASLFSFETGTLTIVDTPLSEAIGELDRWYDVDIRLGDPLLAQQRIEGKFKAESLEDLTKLLELAFDVRVERAGQVMTLYPRR